MAHPQALHEPGTFPEATLGEEGNPAQLSLPGLSPLKTLKFSLEN